MLLNIKFIEIDENIMEFSGSRWALKLLNDASLVLLVQIHLF